MEGSVGRSVDSCDQFKTNAKNVVILKTSISITTDVRIMKNTGSGCM